MRMKHLVLSLLLAVCTVCSAQTNHMKFKGIPIDGTLNSFVQKLKDKGYTFIGQQDGMAILKGEFAATKGCTIGVARFSDRDQVNLVAVIFPEEETWSGITKSYYTLKDMLTEKYGTPECVEQFSDREPSSDFLKFHAILNDECHYVSEFSCENGKIQLTMSKQDYNSAAVILRFALPMAELDVITFEISVSSLYFLQKYAFGVSCFASKNPIRPNIICQCSE